MYRLLIVDDERLDREGIQRQLDWEQYGIVETMTAKSATDALKKLENFPADLVYTDIKMPGINGIELGEKIRQILPDTVVIFISGYDDFQYAKSALNLGALDYVLKPVRTEELIEVTRKAVSALEQKQELKKKIQALSKQQNDDFIAQSVLNVLKEDTTEKELLKLGELINNKYGEGKVWVAAASVDDYWRVKKEQEKKQNINFVKKYFLDLFTPICQSIFVPYSSSMFFFLFIEKEEGEQFYFKLKDYSQAFITSIHSQFGFSITMSLLKQSYEPFLVYQAIVDSQKLLEKKMFLDKGILILEDTVLNRNEEIYSRKQIAILANEAIENIKKHKTQQAYDTVEDLVVYLSGHPEISEKEIKNIFHNFLYKLKGFLSEQGLAESKIFGGEDALLEHLEELETLHDIQEWLKEVCRKVFDAITSHDHSVAYQIVEQVKEYIDDNYMKEISLKENEPPHIVRTAQKGLNVGKYEV